MHPPALSGQASFVTFKNTFASVLQAHTESLSSVFWLIRVDHNETVAFGYISKFQSFKKQSESQKDLQLFQLRQTSETSSQKTLSDNHLGLMLEIRRTVCTVSPNTFPLLKVQKHRSKVGKLQLRQSCELRGCSPLPGCLEVLEPGTE